MQFKVPLTEYCYLKPEHDTEDSSSSTLRDIVLVLFPGPTEMIYLSVL